MKIAFETLRRNHPLIHSITNYVTANDCANLLLACGASPIMADDPEEVSQIQARCSGLNLNLGTPSAGKIEAMLLAGKEANACGHPVVLDPVGVGASQMRLLAAGRLMQTVRFSVIRGNVSEIRALAADGGAEKGVDAAFADKVTEENLSETAAFAGAVARKTGAVVAMTGPIDIVTDGKRGYRIRNGSPMLSAITGAGCMLSALTAAFVASNPQRPLEAAAGAVCAMGLAGQVAAERMGFMDGNASFRNYLIDAIYKMTPEELERGASYETF